MSHKFPPRLVVAFLSLVLPLDAMGAQTCKNIEETAPNSRYSPTVNGTVTDDDTGLTWKRCSEGQTWDRDSSNCTGDADTYTWQEALQRSQAVNNGSEGNNIGFSDWRVPNKNELSSLVERACIGPSINTSIFPNTPSSRYWSATPFAVNSGTAFFVFFISGNVDVNSQDSTYHVRLVRGGE